MGFPQDLLRASSVRFMAARTGWTPSLDIRWTLSQEARRGAMTSLFYVDRKLEDHGSSVASDSPHLALVDERSVLHLALPSWVQRLSLFLGCRNEEVMTSWTCGTEAH